MSTIIRRITDFFRSAATSLSDRDDYLSHATDLCDLERRLRDIERPAVPLNAVETGRFLPLRWLSL